VYGLYPTFTASQVVAKINEWGLDGVLTGIREYLGETFLSFREADVKIP